MRLKLLLLLIVVLTTSHVFSKNSRVKGNKQIVSQEVPIKDYLDIEVKNGVVDVIYQQDSDKTPYLKYEFDDNLLDHVSIKVKNNTLLIEFIKHDQIEYDRLKIYTNSKDLHKIKSTGIISFVATDPINTSSFAINISGVGVFDVAQITAQEMKLDVSGVGSVNIKGKTNKLELKSSGTADFNTIDLEANDVNVQSSGIGSIYVWAKQRLEIQASGMAKIRYKGTPSFKQIDKSGMPSIKEVK